jgi:pimeloyl-ACP methyl ester carboxylesterase
MGVRTILRSIVTAAMLVLATSVVFAQDTGKVGVILMHGKWAPGTKNLENLRQQLNPAGYLVMTPMMPWSGGRLYDRSYEDAMTEIDGDVATLKSQGATRIVVGGQSLGANAAIGYGARHPGLMAIVAISPGHVPELSRDPQVSDSLSRAWAMVAAGRGNDTDMFMDVNQGQKRMLRMTAAIYLSYWDPQGPAVIPTNAGKLSAPLFWAVGSDDPMYPRGTAYAFDKAPANPLSRFVPVSGGHFTVIEAIGPQVVDWLNTVKNAK